MLWKYAEYNAPALRESKQQTLVKIEEWWQQFSANREQLAGWLKQANGAAIAGFIDDHLKSIAPHLMWELGRSRPDSELLALVITPESERQLRPMVDSLIEMAPPIEGWEFLSFRQPCPADEAIENTRQKTGADFSDLRVEVSLDDDNTIGLKYLVSEQAFGPTIVLTEALLGEQLLDVWIGEIACRPAQKSVLAKVAGFFGGGGKSQPEPVSGMQLSEVSTKVNQLLAEVQARLPDAPYHTLPSPEQVDVYQGNPDPRLDDYPERSDTIVGNAQYPFVLHALSGPSFYSQRYSKCNEIFCYLKLEAPESVRMVVDEREKIVEALDAALRAQQAGCVTGAATGVRYIYIDLALADLPKAVQVIRKELVGSAITRNSWLLFNDSTLSDEWISVYENAPPPPARLDD